MNTRTPRLLVVGCALAIGACIFPPVTRPFTGTVPGSTHLDMAGTFSLSSTGELQLELSQPCMTGAYPLTSSACPRETLAAIDVVARTPWEQDVHGTWSDTSHLVFHIDWGHVTLDPAFEGAAALVHRPWSVSGTAWTPTASEAAAILKRIGTALGTEIELVQGGPPPKLEASFAIEGGALRAGEPSTLVVQIANRGPGTAYRVVATTRSGIEALHEQQLSFGAIQPGAEKTRKLPLTVPGTETARDTMLVIALSEGNGFAPGNVSHRVPIAARSAPAIAVRCAAPDPKAARVELTVGQRTILRCTVDNTGNVPATAVELEAAVDSGTNPPGATSLGKSAPQSIAASGHLGFKVPLDVVGSIPIDAQVEITITAKERGTARTARTTLPGVVRKPKLCVPGQLTPQKYQSEITKLRSGRAQGLFTQAELDRLDAELVACLKVKADPPATP